MPRKKRPLEERFEELVKESAGPFKLTEKEVLEIRKRYQPGICTYPELAEEFQVHPKTIGPIVRKEHWRYLCQN